MLNATSDYSFYTLDVSDVLDYGALDAAPPAATAMLAARLPIPAKARAPCLSPPARRVEGFDYRPDEDTLARLAGEYQLRWT